jgi:hypothetical protein
MVILGKPNQYLSTEFCVQGGVNNTICEQSGRSVNRKIIGYKGIISPDIERVVRLLTLSLVGEGSTEITEMVRLSGVSGVSTHSMLSNVSKMNTGDPVNSV